MDLKNIIIIVLIISAIAIGFGNIVSDANQKYDLDINNSYSETYNKLGEMENESSKLSETIRGGEINDATAFETLSIAGYTAIKLSFTSVNTLFSLVNNLVRDLGIPFWVYTLLVILITIGIGYAILTYIFRWESR